jgi:peptidoglycan/xylan/chitin deacetylase (PgdA/CDA1 family)
MYHYVREEDAALPFFRFLHIHDFIQQLDYFTAHYRLLSLDAFQETLASDAEPPPDAVILTFDDGFSDHYRYVYPELRKRNIFGIFYVPTGPLTQQRHLDVHLIHLLTGQIKGEILAQQLRGLISETMIPDVKIREFRELTYSRQNNSEAINYVKRTLNYFIDYRYRAQIIDALIKTNRLSYDIASFYLSPEQIREMHEGGMVIGSHSINHPLLSKLSQHEQEEEIKGSFAALKRIVGDFHLKTFCYPYGGFHSFNAISEQILKQEGCAFSFNVEPRDIARNDLLNRPQALPRYDCNQFPHGAAR